MRDDLHKGAPVPRAWRGLIRRCTRGTWQVDGPAQALKALEAIAREVTPTLIRELTKTLDNSQLSLNPLRDLELVRQRNLLSPLASIVIDQLIISAPTRTAQGNEEFLIGAVKVALSEGVERNLRATSSHVDMKDPKSCKELISRMNLSISRVSLLETATKMVRNESLRAKSASSPIELEEDIR